MSLTKIIRQDDLCRKTGSTFNPPFTMVRLLHIFHSGQLSGQEKLFKI